MYSFYKGVIRGVVEEMSAQGQRCYVMVKVDSDFEPSPLIPLASVSMGGVPQKALILNISTQSSFVELSIKHMAVSFTINGTGHKVHIPYENILMLYNRDDMGQCIDMQMLKPYVDATKQSARVNSALEDVGSRDSTPPAKAKSQLKIVK